MLVGDRIEENDKDEGELPRELGYGAGDVYGGGHDFGAGENELCRLRSLGGQGLRGSRRRGD